MQDLRFEPDHGEFLMVKGETLNPDSGWRKASLELFLRARMCKDAKVPGHSVKYLTVGSVTEDLPFKHVTAGLRWVKVRVRGHCWHLVTYLPVVHQLLRQ